MMLSSYQNVTEAAIHVNLVGMYQLFTGPLTSKLLFLFQLLIASTRLKYSYVCQPVTYINTQEELRVRRYLSYFGNTGSKIGNRGIVWIGMLWGDRMRLVEKEIESVAKQGRHPILKNSMDESTI